MTKIIKFPVKYNYSNVQEESFDDLQKAFDEWYRVGKILNRVQFIMVLGFILLVGIFLLRLS